MKGWLHRGARGLLGDTIFHFLIMVVITQIYPFVKIHRTACFNR